MIASKLRKTLILLMIGTFVSASQAAFSRPAGEEAVPPAETCFDEPGMLDLSSMTGGAGSPSFAAAADDTLETYEIELEDEGGKGISVKAVVGLVIAAAFVGYFLYTVLVPEDEEEEEETGGKEPPVYLISVPF